MKKKNHITQRQARPFNSAVEYALRLLFMLVAVGDKSCDLQRLVAYDYLLVHSGDVEHGPPSLHPAVPFRGTEFLVKRDLIQAGLSQLFARELVEKVFDEAGISYRANELTNAFAKLLTSDYANDLRVRSKWVIQNFEPIGNSDLSKFMNENVGRWGVEFDQQTAINQLEL